MLFHELPLVKMIKVLKPSEPLPKPLTDCYDLSQLSFKFKNLLLSKKGYRYLRDDIIEFTLCRECIQSLKTKSDCPPKFSIANGISCLYLFTLGNFIGYLPGYLEDITDAEHSMVNISNAVHK
jgi:hypothetical protein